MPLKVLKFPHLYSSPIQTPFIFHSKPRYIYFFLFRYNDGEWLHIRVSSRFTTSLIVDLLLLTDGSKYHYVLIKDLHKLVEYVRHKVHRFQSEICSKCFHTCASFETLRRHQELCCQDEDVVIKMPKPGKDDHKFNNLTAQW